MHNFNVGGQIFLLAEEFAAVCARERLSASRILRVQLDVVSQHAATMKRFLAWVALVASLLRVLRQVVHVELVLGVKARGADAAREPHHAPETHSKPIQYAFGSKTTHR